MLSYTDDLTSGFKKVGIPFNPKEAEDFLNALSKSIKKLDNGVADSTKLASNLNEFQKSIGDLTSSLRTSLKSIYKVDTSIASKLDDMKSALGSFSKAASLTKASTSKLQKLKKIISLKNICSVALVATGAYIVINSALDSGIHEFNITGIEDYYDYTGTPGDVLVTVDSGFAFYDGHVRGTPADVINFTNTPSTNKVNLNTSPYSITHVINQFSFIINVKESIGTVNKNNENNSSDPGYGKCSLYRSFEASLALQSLQIVGIGATVLNSALNVGLAGLQQVVDVFFNKSSGLLGQALDTAGNALNNVVTNLGDNLGNALSNVANGLGGAATDIGDALAAAAKAAADAAGKVAAGAAGAAGNVGSGLFGGLAGIGSTFLYIVIAVVGVIIFLNITKKKD